VKDFLLTLSAAVVAVALVVGLLWAVGGAQPSRAEILDKLFEIEARQIRIEQLLTYGGSS
jgi:hypothetical protein